jgi:hypothetical protein
MPRGGARPGAGRKPGGERAKPPGPVAIAREEVRKVLRAGQSPISVLCEIAADETRAPELRVQAAAAALPFLMPRLTASVVADVSDRVGRPTTKALVDRLASAFGRLAQSDPPKLIEADAETEPAGVIEGET